jgi:hypothetical protein
MPTHYRWARGRLGLTHAGMGLLIGKSARTSIRYEQGDDEIPSGIEHLIELMTCNPGDLFGARKRILIDVIKRSHLNGGRQGSEETRPHA